MRVVVVSDERGDLAGPLQAALHARYDTLEVRFVDSLDHVREELRKAPFDAVLVCAGLKRLSLESLRKLAGPSTKLLVLDDDVPGWVRLDGSVGEKVADQVFAHLGLARSASFDHPVEEWVGYCGSTRFERVQYPGITDPVIRARLDRREFPEGRLAEAQRIAQLQGPGLARTLEVFWDDPRPHLLQVVPPGLTLGRLRTPKEGPAEPDLVALHLMRRVLTGVLTCHAAGVSCGPLNRESLWLTRQGEVLLLGRGMTHLPIESRSPGLVAPLEYRLTAPDDSPRREGDAFRLGTLLLELVIGQNPFQYLSGHDFRARQWKPGWTWGNEQQGRARRLIELLATPNDGPVGEDLRALIDANTPVSSDAVVLPAIESALARPARAW